MVAFWYNISYNIDIKRKDSIMEATLAVDLRNCKKGDTLVSHGGEQFSYHAYQSDMSYPHIIIDSRGRKGGRLDNGQVIINATQQGEYDIVQVVPKGRRARRIKI